MSLSLSLPIAVVPIIVGPLQVFLAILPALLLAIGSVVVSLFRPRALNILMRVLWRLKFQLIAVAGAVWLGHELLVKIWPETGAFSMAEAGGDWPMFRGGKTRTGSVPGVSPPTRPGLNWVWKQKGEAFYSSPAVVGNRVYAASASPSALGEGSGLIYCFDADTGAIVWKAAPDGYRPTFSSPVVWEEMLICGEGLHSTANARVIALDLRPGREGKVLWTHETRSHVECTPVVADGKVYFGAGDDGYYCLDARTGRELWHLPGQKYVDAETSLVVHQGRMYAGLGLGGRALCVIDANTGAEIKRVATPQAVFGPGAIATDASGRATLYLGMGTGDYANSAEAAAKKEIDKLKTRLVAAGNSSAEIAAATNEAQRDLAPAGEVWAIDLERLMEPDFKPAWTHKIDQTVLGAIAVSGDELYFGSRDGFVYCLDRKSGKRIARWNAHEPVKASPAVIGEYVYVINAAGALNCLRRTTLEPVWDMNVGSGKGPGESEGMCLSSPVVARGRIFVGTPHDGFLAIGRTGPAETLLWPAALGGPGKGGNPENLPLPETATLEWQFPYSDNEAGQTDETLVLAPPSVLSGDLLVPISAGTARGLLCLTEDPTPGSKPAVRWKYPTIHGVFQSAVSSGDHIFVVDGVPGNMGRRLHAVSAVDGTLLWETPVSADASGVLVAGANDVFVQDHGGKLSRFDLAGHGHWSLPLGGMRHPPVMTGSLLVATTTDPALLACDRLTGAELWRVPLPSAATSMPVLDGDTVLVGTATGLLACRLTDGEEIWRVDGPVASELVLERGRIAYVNGGDELVIVDGLDGRVRQRFVGAVAKLTPLRARGQLLCEFREGSTTSINLIDLTTETQERREWMPDTSWLGQPTTGMVLAGSRVLMGRSGWGLVGLGGQR